MNDILILILYVNFLHSTDLITTFSKTKRHGTSHSLVHSIYFNRLTRRLLHAYTAGTLNEWEIIASMTIYEKKERN
jgi:hypothetical protein